MSCYLKPSVYELEVHKSVHIVTCVKNFKMVLFLEIKSYCYECLRCFWHGMIAHAGIPVLKEAEGRGAGVHPGWVQTAKKDV